MNSEILIAGNQISGKNKMFNRLLTSSISQENKILRLRGVPKPQLVVSILDLLKNEQVRNINYQLAEYKIAENDSSIPLSAHHNCFGMNEAHYERCCSRPKEIMPCNFMHNATSDCGNFGEGAQSFRYLRMIRCGLQCQVPFHYDTYVGTTTM